MARAHWEWMEDAENDLRVAKETLRVAGAYNWACFQAQQAAEKSVKATLIGIGEHPYLHSIKELLSDLSLKAERALHDLEECAERLDLYYVPPRYPNAHGGRATYKVYGRSVAQEAVECAERIVSRMRKLLAELRPE